MAADDDGVAEAFTVLRMTEAAEEDLEELRKKGIVRILDDDLLLAYICDWKINNSIQSDRYKPSIYKSLIDGIDTDTEWIRNGAGVESQARSGKDSQRKDSLGKANVSLEDVKEYCEEHKSKVNPLTFFNYYEEKGWKTGDTPISDWKALLRSWEQKELPKKKYTTAAEYVPPATPGPEYYTTLVDLI